MPGRLRGERADKAQFRNPNQKDTNLRHIYEERIYKKKQEKVTGKAEKKEFLLAGGKKGQIKCAE